MGNRRKQKKIYNLKHPAWFDDRTKGIGHDRQHLGIILGAGQTIRIRNIDTHFDGELTLRLLNDDYRTETCRNFSTEGIEVSVDAPAVPFIDTPCKDVAPTVEYTFDDEIAKELPVYRRGENPSEFFDKWDTQGAEYALVESDSVLILVPAACEKSLKRLKVLDGLLEFYESVFSFYDSLAGLSFAPSRPTDLNSRNRFFFKADKHGTCFGYCGKYWAAESAATIEKFWLNPVATNWCCLHEIGHGYTTYLERGADRHFDSEEVVNNVFAACYQSVMLGHRKYKDSWLYKFGRLKSVEEDIDVFIDADMALNSWNYRSKLYFLMLMVDAAGMNAFTYFCQQYRLNLKIPRQFLDLWSECFTRVGQQLNMTPFIQLVGGYINPKQCQYNKYSRTRAVFPLNRLVELSKVSALRKRLNVESSLALVHVQQLLPSGYEGNVTLRFHINDFSQIYGEPFSVLDGDRYVRQLVVEDKKMVLSNLPIGVYTLELPTGRNMKYQPELDYLVVKRGDNEQRVNFMPKTISSLLSQTIHMLGADGRELVTVFIDHVTHLVHIDINDTRSCILVDAPYASVELKNQQQGTILSKTISSTNRISSHDQVQFSFGDILEIYHQAPVLGLIADFADGVINKNSTHNQFIITATGLQNVHLKNNPNEALLARIDRAAAELRGNYTMLHSNCAMKDDIYLAVGLFPDSREKLLKKYADCLPTNNTKPDILQGNAFTFLFNGDNGQHFLLVYIDLLKKKVSIHLAPVVPHKDTASMYVALQCFEPDGDELFYLDVHGSQRQKEINEAVSLSHYGGEVFNVFHQEAATRLTIRNDMRDLQISAEDNHLRYRILRTGLECIT